MTTEDEKHTPDPSNIMTLNPSEQCSLETCGSDITLYIHSAGDDDIRDNDSRDNDSRDNELGDETMTNTQVLTVSGGQAQVMTFLDESVHIKQEIEDFELDGEGNGSADVMAAISDQFTESSIPSGNDGTISKSANKCARRKKSTKKKNETTSSEKSSSKIMDGSEEIGDPFYGTSAKKIEGKNKKMKKETNQNICDICGKSYSSKFYLNQHKESLHEGLRYSCDVCGQRFSFKIAMQQHRTIHTNEKNFICHICSKHFRENRLLKQHIKTHTKEKPYSCDICGHRWITKEKLKLHRLTHSDSKPYQCTVCGKHFTRKDNLGAHMKLHPTILSSANSS